MEYQTMLELLKKFGRGEYESRVYLALVSSGPVKAGKLSLKSNVPQAKIYDVLNSLANKEVVEVFAGRPKEYKAVSPEIVLKKLFETKEKEILALKEGIKEVGGELKNSAPKDTNITGVWAYKGKTEVDF